MLIQEGLHSLVGPPDNVEYYYSENNIPPSDKEISCRRDDANNERALPDSAIQHLLLPTEIKRNDHLYYRNPMPSFTPTDVSNAR